MAWIEPLDLETWFVQVLAGDKNFFAALAIFAVMSLAGYFRLNGLNTGFVILIFALMFFGYIPPSIHIFIAVVAALLVGMTIRRVVTTS